MMTETEGAALFAGCDIKEGPSESGIVGRRPRRAYQTILAVDPGSAQVFGVGPSRAQERLDRRGRPSPRTPEPLSPAGSSVPAPGGVIRDVPLRAPRLTVNGCRKLTERTTKN